MIPIKHRYTGTTLCEFDVETIKEAAEKGKADLRGAYLRGAYLRGADLRGADLCGAYLCRANLCRVNLCEADLCEANLCGANLREAKLCETNLCGADLCGADLCGADLRGANIDGEIIQRPPISVANITYWCLITDDRMRLGCKLHTHNEWQNFNDGEISAMDDDALDFWKTWKEPLLAMCAAHRSKL